MALFGGIEAGGTKFVCAVGKSPSDLRALVEFPTTTPHATIEKTIHFFQNAQQEHGLLAGIGIASFGPIDLHLNSASYGFITSTPKPGWQMVDIVGEISRYLQLPVGFETDVNAAALAEGTWGAAVGLETYVYLTIGTGIGGGGMVQGKMLHGMVHPEMGHIRLPHDRLADPFPGICPFHGDCLEGMASGPALEKRWGIPAVQIPENHPAWEFETTYLAYGLVNIICTLSPERIILGGGVMQQAHLFPRLRTKVLEQLNGYVQDVRILEKTSEYIVPPQLGKNCGVLGAIALAQRMRLAQ